MLSHFCFHFSVTDVNDQNNLSPLVILDSGIFGHNSEDSDSGQILFSCHIKFILWRVVLNQNTWARMIRTAARVSSSWVSQPQQKSFLGAASKSVIGPTSTSAMPLSDLAAFRRHFERSKNIVILTGAGVSAESGVPTFRGAGGFWRKYESTKYVCTIILI